MYIIRDPKGIAKVKCIDLTDSTNIRHSDLIVSKSDRGLAFIHVFGFTCPGDLFTKTGCLIFDGSYVKNGKFHDRNNYHQIVTTTKSHYFIGAKGNIEEHENNSSMTHKSTKYLYSNYGLVARAVRSDSSSIYVLTNADTIPNRGILETRILLDYSSVEQRLIPCISRYKFAYVLDDIIIVDSVLIKFSFDNNPKIATIEKTDTLRTDIRYARYRSYPLSNGYFLLYVGSVNDASVPGKVLLIDKDLNRIDSLNLQYIEDGGLIAPDRFVFIGDSLDSTSGDSRARFWTIKLDGLIGKKLD